MTARRVVKKSLTTVIVTHEFKESPDSMVQGLRIGSSIFTFPNCAQLVTNTPSALMWIKILRSLGVEVVEGKEPK